MNDVPHPVPLAAPASKRDDPWYHWRRFGLNFLTISILLHLAFGTGATYFVVQTIQAKRKQTFAGGPPSPNTSTRATEHKVQLQKKQQSMSAPAPLNRITTTSNAKVSLPAMPAMPKLDSAVVPTAMSGMGGMGMGLSMNTGGGAAGSSGGSGGALSLFGFHDAKAGTLRGTFFDFKQTPDQRTTPIAKDAHDEYRTAVTQFVQGGFADNTLTGRYFKGPNPLFATQVFVPQIDANEGPKAFGLQGRVQPGRWLIHYQGTVIPPESGTYQFVGVGDDLLVVRFNGGVVLDCGSMEPSGRTPGRYYLFDGLSAYAPFFKGCGEGSSFEVEAGKPYPIDIVIGEWPGGQFEAYLLLKKNGVEYKKDSHGNPILPLFRVSAGDLPPTRGMVPVYDHDGPVWKAVATPAGTP